MDYSLEFEEVEEDYKPQPPIVERAPELVKKAQVPIRQTVVTPLTIRREIECKTFGTRGFYYEMKFLMSDKPREYEVQLGFQTERNLHYGHPVARIQPGTVLDVFFESEIIRTEIEEVMVDEGRVRFKDDFIRPYIMFDPIRTDLEKAKTIKVLNELEEKWSTLEPIVHDIFNKKKYPGGDPTDETQIVYQRGVVGCGKTYQLSQDLLRHSKDGYLQIVSTMNNLALTDAGQEIEERGKRVLHFTQKDYPYSIEKVLKGNQTYIQWKYWSNLEPHTYVEREEKKLVQEKFMLLLSKFVILVTPSKAVTLLNMMKLRNLKVDLYVDEAGQMKFSHFCSLLLYKLHRIWIYGDHYQNAPFDELSDQRPHSCEINHYDPVKLTEDISAQSVAEWLDEMGVPGTFTDVSRRLPKKDGRVVVDFYYRGAQNLVEYARWLESKTVSLKEGKRQDLYVPPSLQSYPHINQLAKDKEASRLWRFLNEFVEFTRRCDFDPGSKTLVVVSPYNHLKNAFRELWDYAFKEELGGWDPTFITSFSVQGATFDLTIFYVPARPTLFVTDRLFLVSVSRHKFDIIIPSFSVKGIIKPGMLALMSRIGLLRIFYKILPYNKRTPDFLKGPRVKLELAVVDDLALERFFTTKTFEFYLKFYLYPFMTDRQRANLERDYTLDRKILDAYEMDPGQRFEKQGIGLYKYVLAALSDEVYTLPLFDPGKNYLSFKGEWCEGIPHSAMVYGQEEVYDLVGDDMDEGDFYDLNYY